jgi:hypothetical protein
MNTRELTPTEESNLQIVRGSAGDYALLFITANGLEKSYLDATLPLRTLFKDKRIHDFNVQVQGPANKVMLGAVVVEDNKMSQIRFSLYRPITKQGDPRFWPSNFTNFAKENDVFCVFVHGRQVHFVNLSLSSVAEDTTRCRDTVATRFFGALGEEISSVSVELLELLRDVAARGPLRAVCRGDTAIGRSIEAALGIRMNARITPDYKGIELKSFRATKPDNGLITLFSKTPDWKRGLIQDRSAGFLKRFGYFCQEKNRLQLYCSVYATSENRLGFRLNLNEIARDLEEFHKDTPRQPIAVWAMDTLHNSLQKKHAETFWIKAGTEIRPDGEEFFNLRSIIHTKRPILPQFDAFIMEGQICMDHTIYEEGSRAGDHGYLFRVRQENFTKLFTGEPRTYQLS